MLISPTQRNKIDLEDYNYKKDLENRLLMAQFSTFDVEVLEEVLNGSIKTPINEIADYLEAPIGKILISLETLSETGLLRIEGDNIIVNKEMRKYYEYQILKFDDDFKPNMQYLESLLKKIPIHDLPNWYSIPKTSDNIFHSILEKNLQTPLIYRRYLQELEFEDPILKNIMDDVFSAPGFKIRSRDLREKYDLTREQFEVYMLHLEFNFVCCLSYNQIGDSWKEVVSPFNEWRDYLIFQRDNECLPIEDQHNIICKRNISVAFVKDMSAVLKAIGNKVAILDEDKNPSQEDILYWMEYCEEMPDANAESAEYYRGHFQQAITKILELNLAKYDGNKLSLNTDSKQWYTMTMEDRAIFLYRQPRNQAFSTEFAPELNVEKHLRRLEKSVEALKHYEWVSFDSFYRCLVTPIGTASEVSLVKVGREWQYTIPMYTAEEKAFIKAVVIERLFQVGLVDIGNYKGEDCFRKA